MLARHRNADLLGDEPDDRLVKAQHHRCRRRTGIGHAAHLHQRGQVELERWNVVEAGIAEIDHQVGRIAVDALDGDTMIGPAFERVAVHAVERGQHGAMHLEIFFVVATATLRLIRGLVVPGEDRDAADRKRHGVAPAVPIVGVRRLGAGRRAADDSAGPGGAKPFPCESARLLRNGGPPRTGRRFGGGPMA